MHARAQVQRELLRLEAGRRITLDLGVFKQMLATALRRGGASDRANATRCCALLSIDPNALRETQNDWSEALEAQRCARLRSESYAALRMRVFAAMGTHAGAGELAVGVRHSAYMGGGCAVRGPHPCCCW